MLLQTSVSSQRGACKHKNPCTKGDNMDKAKNNLYSICAIAIVSSSPAFRKHRTRGWAWGENVGWFNVTHVGLASGD